jgi:asparagine synthase (glutamine-hydrolysing)
MCGICGFITKENIGSDKLKAMNDTMYHRGPNDSGEEIYPILNGYNAGLAQRRLSILDLSPLGHQPYVSEDKRVAIVFNGEIYNFLELKKEIDGYDFKSNCDTEVILASYLKWGIKAIEKFNGMFAIAILDRDKDKLYLCRDRIGKKPLYYWYEGSNIVFGSELKPIMKAFEYLNVSSTINKKVMARYIYQKYIASPDTVFENVYQVEPGMVVGIEIADNLTINKNKFWNINAIYHEKKGVGPKDFDEAKSGLKKILEKAVRNRMIADVPLGTFLSGGYDSSLITAVAQSLSDTPVKTFCVGFEDEKYNEAKYAKEVSKYLGTDHTEFYIGESDMLSLVESIPKYYDEPFAESSQIATMLVSKLAKNDVTVALSGDGGDEFFCGYNIYKKVEQAQKLDLLGEIAHRAGRIGNIESKYPFKLRVISQNRNKEAKTQFIAGNYIKVAENMIKTEGAKSCFYDWESIYNEKNWQERRMLLDMDTYLPSDILCKVDRASMKYSLETRCPILDRDVMEFAFSIPHEFKYKNGIKKYILKELAYDYIPRELLDRPKTGFAVPIDKWLRGVLKSQLLDYTDKDYLNRQGIFEAEYTSDFVRKYLKTGDAGSGSGENYSRTVWALFVFQQWYEYYMK